MTLSGKFSFIVWFLIVSFANSAVAMTVYMNDESEIEAQSAWREGDKIFVRINPELCLTFPASQVDTGKSGIAIGSRGRTARVEKNAMVSTRNADIADELIVASGHRRDLVDIFGRSGRGDLEQLFADTFSPERAEKTLKSCLVRKLSNWELAKVLEWYRSPVGEKIVEADSVWDFNRVEKAASYVAMDSVPGFKERMNLVGQIDMNTGDSELQTKLTQGLLRKMMKDIPENFPNAKIIKERIKKEIPTLEMTRSQNLQNLAYNYRFLSLHDLRDYLRFLRSATGKKYTASVHAAFDEIFKKVALNMEKDFRHYIEMMGP